MLETYNEDLQAAIERYRTEISVGVFVSSHAERHGAASSGRRGLPLALPDAESQPFGGAVRRHRGLDAENSSLGSPRHQQGGDLAEPLRERPRFLLAVDQLPRNRRLRGATQRTHLQVAVFGGIQRGRARGISYAEHRLRDGHRPTHAADHAVDDPPRVQHLRSRVLQHHAEVSEGGEQSLAVCCRRDLGTASGAVRHRRLYEV